MLPLYLFAAHLVGDFVLQTRWQATGKFTDRSLRLRHVTVYCCAFAPLAGVYGGPWRGAAFLALLFVLHYLTDSRRFPSTLGDWIAWHLTVDVETKRDAHMRPHPHPMMSHVIFRSSKAEGLPLPANPWTPIPILIDQTLHVCQIALLAGIFLS